MLFRACYPSRPRRQWHPTPVPLPGKSHGERSLGGCSPWGHKESDTTERLHFHFSLSCIGEANGNPLQCSCLENPRDGRAWWAAVYGVAQSWTWLKHLSSSSSSRSSIHLEVKIILQCFSLSLRVNIIFTLVYKFISDLVPEPLWSCLLPLPIPIIYSTPATLVPRFSLEYV